MIPKPQCLLSWLWKKTSDFFYLFNDPSRISISTDFSLGLPKPNSLCKAAGRKCTTRWSLKSPSFLKRVYLPMLLVEVWYHPHTKPSNGWRGGSWWQRNIQGSFRNKMVGVYGTLEMYEQWKWSFWEKRDTGANVFAQCDASLSFSSSSSSRSNPLGLSRKKTTHCNPRCISIHSTETWFMFHPQSFSSPWDVGLKAIWVKNHHVMKRPSRWCLLRFCFPLYWLIF